MAKLGACLDTTLFTADIVDAGATGVWDANAGTFTVTFIADVACGGAAPYFGGQFSFLTLTLNNTGRVQVTVSGTGSTKTTFQNFAIVSLNGVVNTIYTSPGGGIDACAGGPLISQEDNGAMDVCSCNSELTLSYDDALDPFDADKTGAWTCIFTVTVL